MQLDSTVPARLTVNLEQACRMLGLGRTLGYELARRGEFPGCLRFGGRYIVSLPALEKALGGPIATDRIPKEPEAA